MSQVDYRFWRSLQSRGPVEPGPDRAVEGLLLVATKSFLNFYDNQSQFGEDYVSIFPAVNNGKRCFVRRGVWCPSEGYSASGTYEEIISYEDGCKLLIEYDVLGEEDVKNG